MRELMVALSEFENKLADAYGVSLNEAMVLCALSGECVTASVVVERTGLRPSHASKVIGALEGRELVERRMGRQDKRQMYLSLTKQGEECLCRIKEHDFDMSSMLKPLFDSEYLKK